mmetsp:Transcript_30499/g.51062  ORF Transcript_30499/g.51062 Transcript_30499/m.51062 type:complete len:592 (-) Transcript_30499:514-2289(-)
MSSLHIFLPIIDHLYCSLWKLFLTGTILLFSQFIAGREPYVYTCEYSQFSISSFAKLLYPHREVRFLTDGVEPIPEDVLVLFAYPAVGEGGLQQWDNYGDVCRQLVQPEVCELIRKGNKVAVYPTVCDLPVENRTQWLTGYDPHFYSMNFSEAPRVALIPHATKFPGVTLSLAIEYHTAPQAMDRQMVFFGPRYKSKTYEEELLYYNNTHLYRQDRTLNGGFLQLFSYVQQILFIPIVMRRFLEVIAERSTKMDAKAQEVLPRKLKYLDYLQSRCQPFRENAFMELFEIKAKHRRNHWDYKMIHSHLKHKSHSNYTDEDSPKEYLHHKSYNDTHHHRNHHHIHHPQLRRRNDESNKMPRQRKTSENYDNKHDASQQPHQRHLAAKERETTTTTTTTTVTTSTTVHAKNRDHPLLQRIVRCGGSCCGNLKAEDYGGRNANTPRTPFYEQLRKVKKSPYRYSLTIENDVRYADYIEGYITEKILMAFLRDEIPIYYGPPEVTALFNPKAFIWYDPVNHTHLDILQELEANSSKYMDMYRQPMITPRQLEEHWSIADEMFGGHLIKKFRQIVQLASTAAGGNRNPFAMLTGIGF